MKEQPSPGRQRQNISTRFFQKATVQLFTDLHITLGGHHLHVSRVIFKSFEKGKEILVSTQLFCEKDNRYSFHNIATFYQRSKSKYCIQTHCNYIILHISHTHFRVTTICKIFKMPQIKQCTLFSKLRQA